MADKYQALLAERDGLLAQHHRDSAELRSLCEARDRARKQRDALRQALNVIWQWQPPEVLSQGELVPMSIAIGSNGERDWFREIARAALSE